MPVCISSPRTVPGWVCQVIRIRNGMMLGMMLAMTGAGYVVQQDVSVVNWMLLMMLLEL